MSFDKAIKLGKEKRKPYNDSRAFDYTCRNHGTCAWCESNRLYARRKGEYIADEEIKEAANGPVVELGDT